MNFKRLNLAKWELVAENLHNVYFKKNDFTLVLPKKSVNKNKAGEYYATLDADKQYTLFKIEGNKKKEIRQDFSELKVFDEFGFYVVDHTKTQNAIVKKKE